MSAVSQQDKELLKRLALAEARGEGVVGQALVIRSVFNRQEAIKKGANFNTTSPEIRDIVYATGQYEPTVDSRNSIDQSFSSSQLSTAEEAYNLALDPSALQNSIESDGFSPETARNLVLSTGFDSLGGQGRSDAIRYKNHVFVENVNNFGVTGDSIYAKSVSTSTAETSKDPATGTTTTSDKPVPVPDKDIEIENVYSQLGDGELNDRINELNEEIGTLNEKGSDLWSEDEQERYKQINAELDSLYEVKAIREDKTCNSRQTAKGFTFKSTPECEKFAKSIANGSAIQIFQKERTSANPCGTSELAKINTELNKFFTIVKGIKKYGDLYVNGAINKLSNITSLIRNTSQIIGAVLKILVNRLRDFLLDKIRRGIEDLIDLILPSIAKAIKNTIIQQVVDQIFCKFKDVVKGLSNLVTDFLFELIGKVVNVPFCIAEQFTNALVNNVAAIIDDAIGPVLDQINNLLGGAGKVVGTVFQALDYILGFESFICAKPNCPEINQFKASPWGGPSQSQIDAFNNFAPVPTAEGVIGTVDDYIGNIEIFGQKLNESGQIDSGVTNCDPSAYECGPPRVEIFGGGGIGAAGRAVVDNVGRTIGVSLSSGGSGYTRPPFVSFIDSCEDTFTTGYAEINDDGEVINVVMTSTPIAPPRDGRTEFELPSSLPEQEIENDYVVCLEGFRIKDTGIGYSVNDEIRISPNIPNLEASVKITEFGQIIDIQLSQNICGVSGYPEITINSPTGNGVVIDPILSFVPVDEFDDTSISDVPDIEVNVDSIVQAEIVSDDRDGLISTLRGRKILPENQDFTRRNLIRIVDCVS